MKTIRVVVAVITEGSDVDKRIFATARGYGEYKGWWEFPGGKIEEGETPQQALAREIRDELIYAIISLGFPEELGDEVVKNLGSPKAMRRMSSYLRQVRPKSVELVVDEMLAIRSEIEAWRERKAAQEYNARYNEMRYRGFDE